MSGYEQVALGCLINEYSERNRTLACDDVYSVTNSQGFTPSADYFNKEVFSKDISNYKTVHRGMFAYNPSRVNVGSLAWLKDKDTVVVSPLYVVFKIDESKLRQQLLEYYLHSDLGISQIRGLTSGSVRDSLKFSALKRITMPLPSLDKQDSIIASLDCISLVMKKRREQIAVIDKMAKDIFVNIFGDPAENPYGWEIVTIRDLVTEVKYGTSKPAKENGAYTYLRMNNITYDGWMDFSDLKQIDATNAELVKYGARKGDLLFNRTNSKELVGKTAVYREDKTMVIAGYIIRVRTNEKANTEYISGFLNSKYGKATLTEMCKAIVGQANINAQELQDIRIPLPPLELQHDYSHKIEAIIKNKSHLQTSLAELETTYNSTLQKAFNGELFQ